MISAHVLSGLIAGIAAVMYVSRINAIDASLGTSYHFDSLTVALIGGAVLTGGAGTPVNVAIGAIIVAVIQSGMNNLRIPSEMQNAFFGIIMIIAVFFNLYLQKKKLLISDIAVESASRKTKVGGEENPPITFGEFM